MTTLKALFANGQAGFTVYSPDCAQSRLWGNLDHAIHDTTGFQPVYRQWINHDINSIMRFYSGGDDDAPTEQDPEAAMKKYENIPAEDLKYGHLVVRLFLSGPSLLTVWQGERDMIGALLRLKGATHPAAAAPQSIRGRFWCDNAVCNLLHTSDDLAEAERELRAVHVSLDREAAPMPLIEPIPAPVSYAAHSGLSVLCDVMNRVLLGEGEKLVVDLPTSGDARETHHVLTRVFREAAERSSPSAVSQLINAYLAGEVVTVTRMLKRMPVTKWEHFIIQCGAITRDQWNAPTGGQPFGLQ